ncbi:MAG: DUF4169 family protein [Pseudomonadota bacterium]
MADIINLRQVRKVKKREDKEQRAAANRAFFGLTKEQKAAAKKLSSDQEKSIKGKKLDAPQEDL